MNLYEWEGKRLFSGAGITIPKGILVRRGDDIAAAYAGLGAPDAVVKVQILSGKRGKNGGIAFCSSAQETVEVVERLFSQTIKDQFVASVYIEEKLAIAKEHYLSITYDTTTKQPVLVYSAEGGMDIEDAAEGAVQKIPLDVAAAALPDANLGPVADIAQKLWTLFLEQDARVAEINPLVETASGDFIAADAKIALDDDAFFRHDDWKTLEERTMMGRPPTEREVAVKAIDEGEGYYRGTAGKYIELDGDIAVLFSGGGASISNMDALLQVGLKPANYTEYSGNPPREKVAALARIVLSKPGLKGLWIAGGVANFTNIRDTFHGIIDALDAVKPTYPIVIRRAGPFEEEGMQLMQECAQRNGLNLKAFGKEISMSDTARVLADMIT